MKPNVFVYWEGPKPKWIEVCIESMRRTFSDTCHFNLVTPETARNFLSYAPPANLPRLVHASQRSEYYRAALLYEHGGFYFDADTIGLQPPTIGVNLPQNYAEKDLIYSTWQRPPERVVTAYIYARKQSGVIGAWLEKSTALINNFSPEAGIGWTDLSEESLTPIVERVNQSTVIWNRILWLTLDTFLPIDIEAHPEALFKDAEPEEFIRPHSICFGTNHSWMMHYHPEIMNSDPSTWASSNHVILKLLARYL